MALPKWTDERTAQLEGLVGSESPVSRATVESVASELETTSRSISSKLRKMGYEVEAASAPARSYSPEQEATLAEFVKGNSGEYTYVQIAELFENGEFSAKSIQGKILSMELTEHVKPAEKAESVRTYSEAEESTFIEMANDGASLEAIADALGRTVNSVRGKALSFLRTGEITSIPKQENVKGPAVDAFETLGDISAMTVSDIADALGKTPRGVKTMLTRRGLVASDYDGAAKKAKNAA